MGYYEMRKEELRELGIRGEYHAFVIESPPRHYISAYLDDIVIERVAKGKGLNLQLKYLERKAQEAESAGTRYAGWQVKWMLQAILSSQGADSHRTDLEIEHCFLEDDALIPSSYFSGLRSKVER